VVVALSALAAAPTLDARLARLAADLERNRRDQHAPGAAVACGEGS